jgi:hypothetical protein
MPENEIYSRFAYFDTNILSIIANDSTRWRALQDFLYRDKLCLAISGAQVAELSSDTRLHKPLNDFLTAVPSALIKPAHEILDEEVNGHPARRSESLFAYPLNALYGKQDFALYLSSAKLVQARGEQRQTARIWMQHLSELKSNFPESKSGKYTADQASVFAWTLTIQQLSGSHRQFLERFKTDVSKLKTEVLLSAQIMGLAVFYKYYLSGRTPQDSDFGDMFHLHAMPYCKLVIVERNMCEMLNQIKRKHHVLDGVVVKNLRFLDDWNWTEESL